MFQFVWKNCSFFFWRREIYMNQPERYSFQIFGTICFTTRLCLKVVVQKPCLLCILTRTCRWCHERAQSGAIIMTQIEEWVYTHGCQKICWIWNVGRWLGKCDTTFFLPEYGYADALKNELFMLNGGHKSYRKKICCDKKDCFSQLSTYLTLFYKPLNQGFGLEFSVLLYSVRTCEISSNSVRVCTFSMPLVLSHSVGWTWICFSRFGV